MMQTQKAKKNEYFTPQIVDLGNAIQRTLWSAGGTKRDLRLRFRI